MTIDLFSLRKGKKKEVQLKTQIFIYKENYIQYKSLSHLKNIQNINNFFLLQNKQNQNKKFEIIPKPKLKQKDRIKQLKPAQLKPIDLKPQTSSQERKKYKYVYVKPKKQKSQPFIVQESSALNNCLPFIKQISEPPHLCNNQWRLNIQQIEHYNSQYNTSNQQEQETFFERVNKAQKQIDIEQNYFKEQTNIDPQPLLMSEYHENQSGESILSSLIHNQNIDDVMKTIKETAYKPSVKEFQVSKYRHTVVILYGLALSVTSLLFPLCNPIVNVVKQVYGVDTTIVNLNSLLYLLMHPLFTFPASFVIEKYGVKTSISIGCILCMSGSWLRLLVNENFYLLIFGSVICGMGRPFILNVQGKIVANWFFPKDRSLITSLLSFIITAFTVIGLLFPGFVFNNYDQQSAIDDPNTGRNLMKKLILIEAGIATLFLLPNIVLQKEKPPHPPSYTCTVKRETPSEGLKKVFKNKNFIVLWLIYGIYFGSFNAIGIVQASIMVSYGITSPSENSVIGSIPVASGFVSVIFVSFILKKYYKFKLTLQFFIIGCVISLSIMPQIISHGYGAAIGSSLLNGIFVVPAVPLMLELGIELTFPVSEAIGVGLLFAGGQLWGTAIGTAISSFCKGESQEQSNAAIYTFASLFAFSFILTFFMDEDLRRLRAEKTKNISSVNLSAQQWNQIKSEFGGDVYNKRDHMTSETDKSED